MLLKAEVTIQGTRKMLHHRFGPEALPLEKQEKVGVAGNNPDEWRNTVWFDSKGRLYLPDKYIKACVREGAKQIKKGRSTIMNDVIGTLDVVEEKIFILDGNNGLGNLVIPHFDVEAATNDPKGTIAGLPPFWPGKHFDNAMPTDEDLPVYLDIDGVQNPNTRSRNVRYRVACHAGWVMNFSIQWDSTKVDRNNMQQAVIEAGSVAGVGNGRKIGAGRFVVTKWDITELHPVQSVIEVPANGVEQPA